MSYKFKLGFTIIEFLIIIGLIGIMTTVSVASYTTFTESSKLKNEVQKFVANITLAQKKAVSGDIGDSCLNCSLTDVTVDLNTTSQTYTVSGHRLNTLSQPETFNQTVYSVEPVNKNITFLTASTIVFAPLTGAPDSAKNIVFKNVVKNECMQVAIASTGLISSAAVTCP